MPAREVYAHVDRAWGRTEAEQRPLVSVRRGRHRLIRPLAPPGSSELYDVAADPEERIDLAAQEAATVEALSALIDAHLEGATAPWQTRLEVELDALEREQLRALGYLGIEEPAAEER